MTTRPNTATRPGAPAAGRATPPRALTIHQPWAWAIATELKPIENRSWPAWHRGPIAIHAGLTIQHDAPLPTQRAADAYRQLGGDTALWDIREPAPPNANPLLTRGAIIAIARLTGVCEAGHGCGCGPWAVPGQTHWQLTHVRPLARPVPCRGAQGLWTVPDAIAQTVRAQLKAAG